MPGEAGEGQPRPLNPRARADINESLGKAGVEPDLNPKAKEDINQTLRKAGVDSLKTPPNVSNQDNLPYMKITNENLGFEQAQSMDHFYENRVRQPELNDIQANLGISVSKFNYEAPEILGQEDQDLRSNPNLYEGFIIDSPDKRIVVFKGPLSGATFVRELDREGEEISTTTFYGNLGEILKKAPDIYPPNELPHIIEATVSLYRQERGQLRQKIKDAGGHDKFIMQEAKKLVDEGKHANITGARRAVMGQTDIVPASPQTEKIISEAISSNELPQDITNPQDVERIKQELEFCARSHGKLEEFGRTLPELMRIKTMDKVDKARFAYSLAQSLTETILGKSGINGKGMSDVSFENAQQLSQTELNVTGLGGNKAAEVIKILNYTWGIVEKLQRQASVPAGKPRFRII